MTPQENVEQIVGHIAGLIRASGKRVSHVARDIDLDHKTIDRILGQSDKPNKYSCSIPNIAAIAHHYGLRLALVPNESAGEEP